MACEVPEPAHEVLPSPWRKESTPTQHRIQPFQNNKDERLKKRAETQENVKFHFQAPPMLVQKFPRQLSTLSTVNLFPEPKICFFQNFVQRRWVYSVVETTSYVKKKKSETYRKEFRS